MPIECQHKLYRVLRSAGFPLYMWCANHLALIPDCESSRTELETRWKPKLDEFYFSLGTKTEIPTPVSKRKVLSEVALFFDPLGWMSPFTIQARIIIQRAWCDQSGWDDPILSSTQCAWQQYLAYFASIPLVRISRRIHSDTKEEVELFGFCNASERAFDAFF